MPGPAGLRIVFAGTPDFAVPPLEKLLTEGFRPVAVLTQPDRPAGRGRQLQASPVKQAAEAAGIPVCQPTTLKDPETQSMVASLQPDLLIVVAYGLILPPAVLDLPVHGCWNIHASLLPRWRGAAPIQRAIEAGDTETGVCIMQMDEGLDTGPVLNRKAIRLIGSETGGSLHDQLAQLGAGSLLTCVQALARQELTEAVPQPETGVSYARKLVKSEAQLDWSESAQVLERRVRAFNPWPVAWCDINGERTRIWSSAYEQRPHDQAPGTVLAADKSGIEIATGVHILKLLELQRPGGRRVSAAEYLNAKSLPDRLVSGC
jgi:methionyl-tRNA formyltransferase